jgi:hypothetical protein
MTFRVLFVLEVDNSLDASDIVHGFAVTNEKETHRGFSDRGATEVEMPQLSLSAAKFAWRLGTRIKRIVAANCASLARFVDKLLLAAGVQKERIGELG